MNLRNITFMKSLAFIFFFLFLAQMSYSQEFITHWVFVTGNSEIQFDALTTDTVQYTWYTSPSGNSGNGSFISTSPGEVTLNEVIIEHGDTVTINMAPEHLSRFYLNPKSPVKGHLIDVSQWGDVSWTSMTRAFYFRKNLKITAVDTPDLNNVSRMDSMFYYSGEYFNNIEDWDVSNVTNMAYMFSRSGSFNQDIGDWNVSNVTDMSGMFLSAGNFNRDIGGWDVSNVRNMKLMFADARNFNRDIGAWDVSNVTDMRTMFLFAKSFNQDIGDWNVSNITDMSGMFNGGDSFNQDIGSWDVSNVTDMKFMFHKADYFNQNIGEWNLHPEIDMLGMFDYSGMDCDHYSATLVGLRKNNPSVTDIILGGAGLQYGTSAEAARDSLINIQGWTIEGDEANGMACDELVSTAFVPSRDWHQLAIYPNPSSGQITVKDNQVDFENLRIINSLGQDLTGEVIIRQRSGTSATIDLSGLPAGMYFLQAGSGSGVVYKE